MEVMILGRFINHEGRQRNFPTARFGTIAARPSEPILNRHLDNEKPAFLVEMRSMGGYSGAPVFAMLRPRLQLDLTVEKVDTTSSEAKALSGVAIRPWVEIDNPIPILLGVLVAHSINYEPVVRDAPVGESEETDLWVQANTGLAIVAPAWHIYEELLQTERFKMSREKGDAEISRRKRGSPMPDDTGAQPKSTQRTKKGYEIPIPKRDDVMDVFKKATRKRKP
jgi:hypothetical protein